MLQEAARHLENGTSLETIYFVLFDDAGFEIFQSSWKRMVTAAPRPPVPGSLL
jgi:hypothetical protein